MIWKNDVLTLKVRMCLVVSWVKLLRRHSNARVSRASCLPHHDTPGQTKTRSVVNRALIGGTLPDLTR